MGRVKNTTKNATVKCVRAVCVMTGWTIGMTVWGVRGASSLTKRAVRAVIRTLPETTKKKRSPESKQAVVQPPEKVSFAGESLLKSIRPEHIREEPKAEIGFYEDTLLKQALRDISNEQPGKRYNAVMTLASVATKLGPEAVIGPLVKVMKDQNGNIRSQACKVLVDLKVISVVNEITLLLKDNNPRVRLEALRGIYKLSTGTSSILYHLVDAARDQHREIRKRAATYLGWIEDDEAVSTLIDLLSDSESIVRKTAVLALGELRDKKAIMPLISLLGDKNGEVREVAVYTLRILTGQNFGYDSKSEGEERNTEIEKWNKWWDASRAAFTIYRKEFIVSEVSTIGELERLKEAEGRSRSTKKEAMEKAKEEEEAKELAKEKAIKKPGKKAKKEVIAKKEAEAKPPKETESPEGKKALRPFDSAQGRQDAERPKEVPSEAEGRSRSAKEKPAAEDTPKGVASAMSEKIGKLKKAGRVKLKEKLGTRLKSIREKLDKRKVGENSEQKELNSLKTKMKDLEQMLLLKEEKKTEKKESGGGDG